MQSENAGAAALRRCLLREQPEAVVRMREVIAKRRIRAARLDLVAEPLHQIAELAEILGLIGVEDLRLQVAAFLCGRSAAASDNNSTVPRPLTDRMRAPSPSSRVYDTRRR